MLEVKHLCDLLCRQRLWPESRLWEVVNFGTSAGCACLQTEIVIRCTQSQSLQSHNASSVDSTAVLQLSKRHWHRFLQGIQTRASPAAMYTFHMTFQQPYHQPTIDYGILKVCELIIIEFQSRDVSPITLCKCPGYPLLTRETRLYS